MKDTNIEDHNLTMLGVLERSNMLNALKRVKTNKGCSGVDGMTVEDLPKYLKQEWPLIREQLISGKYKPQPVKEVQIPKPNGDRRKLGIPTVLDRLIQQAICQNLEPYFDKGFSEFSFGFRKGRNAHQAIQKAKSYQNNGKIRVIDIDLEKFFDKVNHDRLMSTFSLHVKDKPLIK